MISALMNLFQDTTPFPPQQASKNFHQDARIWMISWQGYILLPLLFELLYSYAVSIPDASQYRVRIFSLPKGDLFI